jgi:hypothetical protein
LARIHDWCQLLSIYILSDDKKNNNDIRELEENYKKVSIIFFCCFMRQSEVFPSNLIIRLVKSDVLNIEIAKNTMKIVRYPSDCLTFSLVFIGKWHF